MTVITDTGADINDVLGVMVEDASVAARKAAIAAAKSARWTWTIGQLIFGGDTARAKARRRRLRIKRERAARARRAAAEQARRDREQAARERQREQAEARSTTRPAESTTRPHPAPPTNTKTAGQAPSPPKVQQHQSTNTPPSPLRAGARTGAVPTPLGVVMAGEAVDYETTESALQDIATELSTHAGTIEMLSGSLSNAGIGGDTSALLSEALEMTLAGAKVLEAAHEQFVQTQGAINELARAAGGVGSNEFHGVG